MTIKPEVFISYAWGQPQEAIVDKLYQTLKDRDYVVVRDKVDLTYKGSLKGFMNRLGAGKAIALVLSDKYLRSKNCMYEAIQIASHGNFSERIFPILLRDANIFDPNVRLQYINYWGEESKKLNQSLLAQTDLAHTRSILDELDGYNNIRHFIDSFMGTIADMNVLTPEIHADSDFSLLRKALDDLFARDDEGGPQ